MRKRTVTKKQKRTPTIHLSREGERELVRAVSSSLVGGMGQGLMASVMQGDRFIQIAGDSGGLYALDARGQVWAKSGDQWMPVTSKRAPLPTHDAPAPAFGFPPRNRVGVGGDP